MIFFKWVVEKMYILGVVRIDNTCIHIKTPSSSNEMVNILLDILVLQYITRTGGNFMHKYGVVLCSSRQWKAAT